jgi:hypothetical protein
MKRLINIGDGRHFVGDDLAAIQEQANFLEAFFSTLDGPFVVSGCEVTSLGGSLYSITAGILYLNGSLIAFPAQTSLNLASGAYIAEDSAVLEAVRPYADLGSSQPGIEKDVVEILPGSAPGQGQNLTVRTDGLRTLAEAIRDATFEVGMVQMFNGPTAGNFAGNGVGIGNLRGWALADGQGGRPDLRNRFIVGSGAAYVTGNTGGVDEVTLTAAQSGLPAHTHPRAFYGGQTVASGSGVSVSVLGSETEQVTANAAQAAADAHENRPPYFALAYLIWIGTTDSSYYVTN